MINVIINGCNGKMGQVITTLIENDPDIQVAAGFDPSGIQKNTYPVFSKPKECPLDCDVIIDFSHPEALDALIEYAAKKQTPLVIATTGLPNFLLNKICKASHAIPIFQSANMSLGVNLLIDLVVKAAKVLEENFDIEIVEKHHNQKIDAPSGTALMFADSINSALANKNEYIYDRFSKRTRRGKNEIGIHSLRGGTIVGEHSVVFAGNDEIVEINHKAMSRNIFGIGAIKAAKYLIGKPPGMYSMKSLISD